MSTSMIGNSLSGPVSFNTANPQHLPMITSGSGWETITLPPGVTCAVILIQVHDGDPTSTDVRDNPEVFSLSFDGGISFTKHTGAFAFDNKLPSGADVCQVKTVTAGKKIAVFISA